MDLNVSMSIEITTLYTDSPLPGLTARPDNSWQGRLTSDEKCCGASSRGFGCTARPGHHGDHMAYGSSGQVCHSWPQDEPLADWERELLATGRPGDLPAGADWPPAGRRVIYTFPETGLAVCSECITDPEKVDTVRRDAYADDDFDGGGLARISRLENEYWYCSHCEQKGSRL